jgi:glycosyltransferase involved in cell wall biosynthesis
MNVLYLTNNAGRASTTVATRGWFENLLPRGLRPVVVSPVLGEFADWCGQRGIPVYRQALPVPSKKNPFRFLRSLWRLRRLARRHRIQLVHANEQDVYPISQWLARVTGLPVVVTVHFPMDRAYCKWAFAGKRRPARMFFISQGHREACRQGIEGVVPEEDWRLLPNGLDLERYRPDSRLREEFRREHNLNGGPLIGAGCAFREVKQLEHLFEAAARLPENVRVVLAGFAVPGHEAYADKLLADGRRRLGARLVHVGCLSDMRGLYNALDLFVNTSQEEACSISVLEALACGCPVIGYPSKSVHNQVLPDGGEIVEQDSIDQLAHTLLAWLNSPAKVAQGRLGARRRVETEYDMRQLSNQLWEEYRTLVPCIDGRSGLKGTLETDGAAKKVRQMV